MSRGEVIDFEVLRIQNELDYFQSTGLLPHIFLDGRHTIDEILALHYVKLSANHQEIADSLNKNYDSVVSKTISDMKVSLNVEYTHIMGNLASEHKSFRFDFIEEKYRPGLNPLRALYYEVREVSRKYNPENPDHRIRKLEKLVKKFYRPLRLHSKSISLEMFHVKQMISDFTHYREIFLQLDIEGFDE